LATLVEILRDLVSGGLPARAYTDRLLERIRARDGRVFAFAHLDFARARALADACDLHRANGGVPGPLHGLPVALKDVFDTADLRTEAGIAAWSSRQPTDDAVLVQRLRAAGGFVLGKTITSEAAFVHPPETRNPWNPQHTPGGSSAGSAAAVAAGFVHAAIGTQTNGSVIRPAAFCGVVGYKPSAGLVPLDGALQFSSTLCQAGFFTRSVADAAAFAAPLAEPGAIAPEVNEPSSPPRVGLILEYPWTSLEPEARQKTVQVVRILASAGANVTMIDLPPRHADANMVHRLIMLHEGVRELGDLQERARGQLSAELNAGLDEGRRISRGSYGEAMLRRARWIEAAGELFAKVDVILSPPAAGPAPARLEAAGDTGFCTLWNLLGLPMIVVPCTVAANGLPIGMQVVGPAGEDARVLAVAHWIENVLGRARRAAGASRGNGRTEDTQQ